MLLKCKNNKTMNILIKKHLESRGEKFKGDHKVMGEVITPYLLFDVMRIIITEDLQEVKKTTPKARRYFAFWMASQKNFNKNFFAPFTEKEQFELVDYMDEFGSYIHNDLTLVRICALTKYEGYSEEMRKILASCLCCNIMAQSAQYIYKGSRGVGCHDIDSSVKWSYEFMLEYSKREPLPKRNVSIDEYKDLHDLVVILCKKIKNFTNGRQ